VSQAGLALATGRIADAGALVPAALAVGELPIPVQAIPAHRLQWYTLCELTGSFTEIDVAIRGAIAAYPARRVFRCIEAHLNATLGQMEPARTALNRLAANDFAFLPFDQEWLYGMSLLAETAVALDDKDAAMVLHRLLLPWASLNATDPPETMRGAISRYLGLLATTLEQWKVAEGHYQRAVAMNRDMGARPWLAHTQSDYARMLLRRDAPGDRAHAGELLSAACSTFGELGMTTHAASASELERRNIVRHQA
jgi:hypothetical protein